MKNKALMLTSAFVFSLTMTACGNSGSNQTPVQTSPNATATKPAVTTTVTVETEPEITYEYVSSEFDSTALDAKMDEEMDNAIKNGKLGYGDWAYSFFKEQDGDAQNNYKIKNYHITPVKTCFEYIEEPNDNEFHNRYIRFYDVSFVIEKADDSTTDEAWNDGRAFDEEFESDKLMYYVYTDDVMLSSENEIKNNEFVFYYEGFAFKHPNEVDSEYRQIENILSQHPFYYDYNTFWEEAKKQDANKHPSIQVVFEKDLT